MRSRRLLGPVAGLVLVVVLSLGGGVTAVSTGTASGASPLATRAAPPTPAALTPDATPSASASPSPDAVIPYATPTPDDVQPASPPATSAAPVKPRPGVGPDRLAWATASYSTMRGGNGTDKVVLSFDDCPASLDAFRATVLAAESQGIALVLFPTGNCLKSKRFDPDFARAHGHYVFNHSVSHPQFSKISADQMDAQLSDPGVQGAWGRPPYGELNPDIRAAYQRAGMRIWLWSVDTRDWAGHPDAATVVSRALAAKAGGTVLMHMQEHAFNADALAQLKSGLAAKGLSVCANRGPTSSDAASVSC